MVEPGLEAGNGLFCLRNCLLWVLGLQRMIKIVSVSETQLIYIFVIYFISPAAQ